MSVSVVSTEDGKISCKTTEPSVININISQRSFWDSLADNVNTWRKIKSEVPATAPTSPTSTVSYCTSVALGVSQIPLGVICVAVGVIANVADIPLYALSFTGALFWMGIPFILSGVSEVVAYIKNSGFWVFLSCVCQLLSFCVSIAGLVLTVDTRHYIHFLGFINYSEDPCVTLYNNAQSSNNQSNGLQGNSYNQYNIDNGINRDLKKCQRAVKKSQDAVNGLLIILLIICSWVVISIIIAAIYRLKRLSERCSPYKKLAEQNPLETSSPYPVTA